MRLIDRPFSGFFPTALSNFVAQQSVSLYLKLQTSLQKTLAIFLKYCQVTKKIYLAFIKFIYRSHLRRNNQDSI